MARARESQVKVIGCQTWPAGHLQVRYTISSYACTGSTLPYVPYGDVGPFY